ncbi:MAG: hypothetical protein DMG05_24905 [Acidobacteria bacterium]|nr:MAG: hypothetical protein DMG05_24905 [Acidobacteriota bacterium]
MHNFGYNAKPYQNVMVLAGVIQRSATWLKELIKGRRDSGITTENLSIEKLKTVGCVTRKPPSRAAVRPGEQASRAENPVVDRIAGVPGAPKSWQLASVESIPVPHEIISRTLITCSAARRVQHSITPRHSTQWSLSSIHHFQ